MKFFLSGPVVCAIYLMIVTGCSFPGISESDGACPELDVAFVGTSHPFICAGESVPVRVAMADKTAEVKYAITSSNGTLSPLFEDAGQWQFFNDGTPGITEFNVYISSSCGWRSKKFSIMTVDCPDTSSESDTGTSDDSDTSDTSESVTAPKPPPEIDYDGPRHVILFIGDGMGYQCEIGLSRYLYGTDNGLSFHQFDYENYVTTWDVNTYNRHFPEPEETDTESDSSVDATVDGDNSDTETGYNPDNVIPIWGYNPAIGGDRMNRGDDDSRAYLLQSATDSGAAATALATGQKTANGNISWERHDWPDGEIPTIAEQAQEMDMKVGVVSTVAFSHATPAAFVSHDVSRSNYHDIAREIIFRTSPDVVISAGSPEKSGSFTALSEAEYNWLNSTTTLVFTEWAEGEDGGENLKSAASEAVAQQVPLFGLFGTSVIPMPSPLDSPGSPAFDDPPMEEPSLAEMTMAAVRVLSENDKGFFLMVEGGTIDKANHSNDYEWMLGSARDFERAVQAAVDWVNEDGDNITLDNTLIIVTADHANGYISYDETNPLSPGELPRLEDEVPRMTYGSSGHTNEPVRIHAEGAGIAGGAKRLFETYQYVQYPNLPMIDNTHIYTAMAYFLGVKSE